MKKRLIKTLMMLICLTFAGNVFAETEEEVIVVTNVAYTASLTKKASNESGTINPADGTHTGLSSVFTLQTNGSDEHFDYILTSNVTTSGDVVPAYANDGRLLFGNITNLPTTAAVDNARTGYGQSKNVLAYPTSVSTSGGLTSMFIRNYKTYGNCYAIFVNDNETGNVTHSVSGSPCANTYEPGLDEAGTYRAVVMFTIVSK